jgi:prepilin-type N-terminal cleavage/methylation domain-containing protein
MRRASSGFTLVELLIVVVIIGILAAIAIPKFTQTKEKSYMAMLKSDLRNLVTVQETYFADNNLYSTLAQLTAENRYSPSRDVTLATANETATGWSATATHSGLVTYTACGVYMGTAPPPNAALSESGEVGCW